MKIIEVMFLFYYNFRKYMRMVVAHGKRTVNGVRAIALVDPPKRRVLHKRAGLLPSAYCSRTLIFFCVQNKRCKPQGVLVETNGETDEYKAVMIITHKTCGRILNVNHDTFPLPLTSLVLLTLFE